MIFSVVILLLVLGVTYMSYLQGAFTSAISAACALAATLVAFGYYESLVNMANQNSMADYAAGASMILLFVVTYVALRVAIDAFVPGNLQLQLYVEKTLAVGCGFLAAMMGAGTFATAVQMMPVGADVFGYARYELRGRDLNNVPGELVGRRQGAELVVMNELVPDKFDNPPSGMLLPADDFVNNLVRTASDGAFSGNQSFAKLHPDLPTEAFAARLGAETSGKKTILNTAKAKNVNVRGLFTLATPPRGLDAESLELREKRANLPPYKPSANESLVVVRVTFEGTAADKDGSLRLTAAAAPLTAGNRTFYPIATMETAATMGLVRLDDTIIVPIIGDAHGVDLVYALPKPVADALNKPAGDGEVRFVQVKLFGRVDLAGEAAKPYPGVSKEVKVARKKLTPLGTNGAPPAQ